MNCLTFNYRGATRRRGGTEQNGSIVTAAIRKESQQSRRRDPRPWKFLFIFHFSVKEENTSQTESCQRSLLQNIKLHPSIKEGGFRLHVCLWSLSSLSFILSTSPSARGCFNEWNSYFGNMFRRCRRRAFVIKGGNCWPRRFSITTSTDVYSLKLVPFFSGLLSPSFSANLKLFANF